MILSTERWRAVPRIAIVLTLAVLLVEACPTGRSLHAADRPQRLATDETFHAAVLPVVRQYCVDCHGEDDPEGDVSFANLDNPSRILQNRSVWEKALRQLGIGGMPPTDEEHRPSRAEQMAMVDWLDLKLFHCDCSTVDDVGRETIHRLNRAEYDNTIRDLMGVDLRAADDFPSDEVGYGFSNMGDVLSLPPLLFEKYLDAAEEIAATAIVAEPGKIQQERFAGGQLQFDGSRARIQESGWLALNSAGTVYRDHVFERPGQYDIVVRALAEQAGPELAKIGVSVDGESVEVFEVPGHREPGTFEIRRALTKGRHRVEVRFLNDYYRPRAENPRDRDRNVAVRWIEVHGPIGSELPASHRRIVFTRPAEGRSAGQAAREILGRFLPRAFRRPATNDEIDRFAELVEFAMQQGDSFERGVQFAVATVLVSPHFLFRVETDTAPNDPTLQHAVTDFELASRVSYFLWSTMPDDDLFQVARQGTLHQPEVLDAQIERMLRDPKADALVDNFVSQWLNLGELADVAPDRALFPEFTPELRTDMLRETKLLARSILREDRSLLDFLNADYTFLNERLARHYGIDGIEGEAMRRVSLAGTPRAGVLGHASILTLTSNPDRTSLVRRGNWVVNNVLGLQLPDPPASIPSLEEGAKKSGASTLREQLALHRADPLCASCHNTLDPLGFGLENFDAIGRWREEAEGKPVESGGVMPSGESFRGPRELITILTSRQRKFAELLTRKTLTYALGRGLEIADSCTVDDVVAELEQNDYRWTVLVRGVVHSRPFLMRRGERGAQP